MTVSAIRLPARSGRTVRSVVAEWRRLTGGRGVADPDRRTLVACSGGGDSSGLVLALAAGVSRPGERLVIGHIVHDLRPEAEALADRDSAEALAGRLGVPFTSGRIAVRGLRGNAEGNARRARYAALAGLAEEHGCRFVATAHHAGDQLETVLMGLLRGAGPRGLGGVAARRRGHAGGPAVIRPALGVTRDALRALCRAAGWAWREDATNADVSRLRAAVRARVSPALESLRPGAAARVARSAALLKDAAAVVDDRVRALLAEASGAGTPRLAWERGRLRGERGIVVGGLVRAAAARLRGGRGRDRLGGRVLEPVVRAVRSRSTEPKVFVLSGVEVRVDAHRVEIGRTDG
ncbi:MAG: tRNA lysidine(34) synthetase TilS [Phycisphaerales bacterium]